MATVLKQVSVPSTPIDKYGWERAYRHLIYQEMEPGLTPARAAAPAQSRLRQLFGAAFPGFDLPFSIEGSVASQRALPGGVRTEDGRFWLVIARVEDDKSFFSEDERIDHELLRSLAETFDPDFRGVPLVPPGEGPAHIAGQYAREIPGFLDAMEFDGHHLWGLARETKPGSLVSIVESGVEDRSIKWWPELPELDGNPPYMEHVALLSGERPGISNMGPNSESILAQQGLAQADIRRLLSLPSCQRSIGHLPLIERSTTMPEKTTTPANQDGTPDTRNEPSIDVDELVRTAVTAALAQARKADEPKPDAGASVRDAVAAAIKPLADELAEFRAEQKNTAAQRRQARITERLDQFVRDGKLSPADRDTYGRLLANASDEDVDKELEALGKRSKIALLGNRASTVTIDDSEVRIPAHLRPKPGEAAIDPNTMRTLLKAREAGAAESDPERAYMAKRRAIYAAFGEELPN